MYINNFRTKARVMKLKGITISDKLGVFSIFSSVTLIDFD